MSDTVISVENLSKQYRLGEIGTGSLAHDVNRWWHKIRGKEDPYLKIGEVNDRTKKTEKPKSETLKGNISASQNLGISDASSDYVWSLRDVSFEVKRGEVLGIIGRNGAGKSTLLKILSRVTQPTTGQVKVKGRIASLLEVGTGFHPELSGRENIYLNGAILGMRHREIARKFDEIVDFAGVERYIDTPVKRYSSGMYVRLAFAVAAHLEPEILIVDEVLAVGDAEFQKKCLGKMKDVAGHGRTVLFVSHNMAAVRTLCDSAMLMESGKLRFQGPAESAIGNYLTHEDKGLFERRWDATDAPGDDLLRLRSVVVRGARGQNGYFPMEEDIFLDIEYEVLRPHPRICVSIHLYTEGTCAFVGGNTSSSHDSGIFRATCRIPSNLLNNNLYDITVFLISNTTELRVIERDVVSISVEEFAPRGEYVGRVIGAIRPALDWKTTYISPPSRTVAKN